MHEDETGGLRIIRPGMCSYERQWVSGNHVYLRVEIHRSAASEDEVDGALNVAVFEQMPAVVIKEGVLIAIDFAVVECCGVSAYS